jgi:putative transposase
MNMKRKRYTEEQIIGVLKEAESGLPVDQLIRKNGISGGTFYRWKSKYGGMDVSEARRLKALEEEIDRLKRLVADQALDVQILKDTTQKTGKARTEAHGRRLSKGDL